MTEEQLLNKSPEELAITNNRAMFYRFLARPDSITKVFNKTAVLDIQDIRDLNQRVSEKLSHYQEAGYLIQTNVKFADGKTRSFPDWSSFDTHDWYESEHINNMVITWSFNAVFPGRDEPQMHTLMVKLSNGLRPEEMLNLVFTGKIEDIEEMDNNLFPIVTRVDFVDRVLADELLFLVEEWVKTLRESELQKTPVMLFLQKNKAKVASLMSWVTNIVIMCTSVIMTGNYIAKLPFKTVGDITPDNLIKIIYALFICSATWIFGKKLVGRLTDALFERLRLYGDNALFNITKGDKNRQEKIIRKEKWNKKAIIWNLIVTICINILCGFIVNYLS